MNRFVFMIALIVLLLQGCVKEEALLLQDGSSEIDFRNGEGLPVERPFLGRISNAYRSAAEQGDFGVKFFGNMTHLGKTIVEFNENGDPFFRGEHRSTLDRFVIEGAYAAAPPMDTIIIITDFFTFPDPDDEESTLIEGEYFITGGTGRFEKADGNGKLTGKVVAELENIGITLQYEGTIIY